MITASQLSRNAQTKNKTLSIKRRVHLCIVLYKMKNASNEGFEGISVDSKLLNDASRTILRNRGFSVSRNIITRSDIISW